METVTRDRNPGGRPAQSVRRGAAARAAYGAIFVIALPLALVVWGRGAAGNVHLPAIHAPVLGIGLIACGVVILLSGMFLLWRQGGGLPMNAFPPARYVTGGAYALVPHPIYGGFVIACAGAAIWTGSASGLWLVAPSVALGCAALVLGYELPDLRARFGRRIRSPWLPETQAGEPKFLERLRIYFVVVIPWLVCFELIGMMGPARNAVSSYFRFEQSLPIWQWTEAIYASAYLAVLAAPLLIASRVALRRFALRGLMAMGLIFPLYLMLPFYVPPRAFAPDSPLGTMLSWERTPISGIGAIPSFHVVWACNVAATLGDDSRARRIAFWTWAILVALSCVTTGMHSIADVLAGFVAYGAVVCLPILWRAVLCGAERVANSWREWRIGPVRIINHGGYAAVAACVGILIIAPLLGRGGETVVLSMWSCSIAGAVLWAQIVEGSPALLRPLGFYGGMLGAIAGALPALLFRSSLWPALAAVCVAAPWIQALGRLRCLVQGCCHGRPSELMPGIRYTHPRSRVCRLTMFGGIQVHATPVYSILWNVVVGLALLRLIQVGAGAATLLGIYLLLSGCGRFVEEAYRGEPQTSTMWGLRLYQWIAIAVVLAGAAATCVPRSQALMWSAPGSASWLLAVACGALTWFISGVDFPESSRRFARLT